MRIHTAQFGEVEINPDNVITFPEGVPGFEHCRRYTMFHDADSSDPVLYRLQSLDEPDLMFTVTDPARMGFHYEIELSDEETAQLQVGQPADVLVLVMLSRQEEEGAQGPIAANVNAPVLLNVVSRLALQKPLGRLDYSITFKAPRG